MSELCSDLCYWKDADLCEMCDELDALLTGNITGTWSAYT